MVLMRFFKAAKQEFRNKGYVFNTILDINKLYSGFKKEKY